MEKDNKVSQLLEDIQNNKDKSVLVYSLKGCPACKELKTKFDKIGLSYDIVEMNGNDDMWKELEDRGGSDFAPQVEVDGYLIKEKEYTDMNQLISVSLSNLLNRKIIIK